MNYMYPVSYVHANNEPWIKKTKNCNEIIVKKYYFKLCLYTN